MSDYEKMMDNLLIYFNGKKDEQKTEGEQGGEKGTEDEHINTEELVKNVSEEFKNFLENVGKNMIKFVPANDEHLKKIFSEFSGLRSFSGNFEQKDDEKETNDTQNSSVELTTDDKIDVILSTLTKINSNILNMNYEEKLDDILTEIQILRKEIKSRTL